MCPAYIYITVHTLYRSLLIYCIYTLIMYYINNIYVLYMCYCNRILFMFKLHVLYCQKREVKYGFHMNRLILINQITHCARYETTRELLTPNNEKIHQEVQNGKQLHDFLLVA